MTGILDPERWKRVVELFDEASALLPQDRPAFLDARCGDDTDMRLQVESLLEFDRADNSAFESGIHRALRDEASSVQAGQPPFERLGSYRLLSEIGRGGMGTVYLAERDDDLHQRVAIKLVRAVLGGNLSDRFLSERQILASLQHPGIARLIDGGTTPGGLPYLVMEHVDGVPITEYCKAHALGARGRLELFRRVCDAVSHAHRNLVVHRDIKPSNILVTADGTPKLLDFGIAKLLAPDASSALVTTPSMRLLTPEYASPEQIRGEPITTGTDVYSLGVLLLELLTGTRPGPFESRRSDETRDLEGDLDTIVRAALETDPSRRYRSVERLSDDLQRFLEGRPVLARPTTWRYRAGHFVNRHRMGVATAAAFAVLVLVLAATLARSIARAERERDAANRVSTVLLETFSEPADRRGASTAAAVTARERLDRGIERVRRDLRDEPAIQARLFEALGAIYSGLGLMGQAQAALSESIAAGEASGGAVDSPETARTMWRLADALRERGQYAAAEPLARRAFDMTTRLFGHDNPQTGQTLNTLGVILAALGRQDEAERMFVDATAIFRGTLGPEHPMVGASLTNLAIARRDKGDLAGAERISREAFALRQRTFGAALADDLNLLADVVRAAGRPEEADQLRRDAARQDARGLP